MLKQLITQRLNLVPFNLEVAQIAIKGNDELASFLGVKVLPDWYWHDDEFSNNFSMIADILSKYPFQREWGWGSLIIHQADNMLIGHVMVKVIPDSAGIPTGSLEIGYYVASSYRQRGYALEATKAVIDWAFSQSHIQSVTAGCDHDNIASQRLLEKIGMELVESRKNSLVWKLCRTAMASNSV
ncbi:GNAT family N-acetyltransferase [Nostoc sp. FACHB-87]|uniref:GNAT family N-acetyltransferase n=1 Tax=Nostocales TaxID=1161 RepID=UPI0016882D5A|nr:MULTISPECIES: GNAT family N-acetyltransferase [Nostocales]MBD2454626.1 GNAT family N-acetyltransferase [Nostoc sp. FACHB-87]MBD2476329.1 GNAT family N-acetyltransferase [Anabaena sp. FACHB-83]MBD2488274.1 GNAT family N-acetyltransferase [Aulosira sp. FACHB-615]